MGFWLYYILPLLISLILIALTKWQKFFKIKTLLKIAAVAFLLIAFIFAGFVIVYDFQNNVNGMNGMYVAMLVVMIAYVAIAEFFRPNK